MTDTRTELDKELELYIFGCVGESPPAPGSLMDVTITLASVARELGRAEIVEQLREMVGYSHQYRDSLMPFISGHEGEKEVA